MKRVMTPIMFLCIRGWAHLEPERQANPLLRQQDDVEAPVEPLERFAWYFAQLQTQGQAVETSKTRFSHFATLVQVDSRSFQTFRNMRTTYFNLLEQFEAKQREILSHLQTALNEQTELVENLQQWSQALETSVQILQPPAL